MDEDKVPEEHRTVAKRLGLPVNKMRTSQPELSATSLWENICRRTDEIYLVGEVLLPVFEETMKALVERAGLNPKDLKRAPGLKDPVRLHEKALAYESAPWFKEAFTDGEMGEATVTDMLRASALCPDSASMLATLDLATSGFECELPDGTKAHLELIESNNKARARARYPFAPHANSRA